MLVGNILQNRGITIDKGSAISETVIAIAVHDALVCFCTKKERKRNQSTELGYVV